MRSTKHRPVIARARAWATPAAIVNAGTKPFILASGTQAKWVTAIVTLPKARAAAVRGRCLMYDDEFVDWYCSEPRLAFNRIVVLRYRLISNLVNSRQVLSICDWALCVVSRMRQLIVVC